MGIVYINRYSEKKETLIYNITSSIVLGSESDNSREYEFDDLLTIL